MFAHPYPGDEAPEDERRAWADKECQSILYELWLREFGLLMPLAGLLYKVPLCHDATEY